MVYLWMHAAELNTLQQFLHRCRSRYSSVDTGVSYMYAIVIGNDLLQKIDKSKIFDTAEIRDNTVTLS